MTETKSKPSAPLLHRVVLALFLALNGTLLFLFLMHLPFGIDPIRLAIVGWSQASPRIDIVFGVSLLLAVGGYHLVLRLPERIKNQVVFFGGRYAHPGHEAFYSLKEPPFDRKPLLKRYPEVRDSAYHPEVQYATWSRLLDKHAAVPVIAGSLTGWTLLSDLYVVANAFLAAFLLGWVVANTDVNVALALSYLFLFGAQAMFLMFSARGTAKRLVYNVLAVELGIAGDSGYTKPKKKPGKRF